MIRSTSSVTTIQSQADDCHDVRQQIHLINFFVILTNALCVGVLMIYSAMESVFLHKLTDDSQTNNIILKALICWLFCQEICQ
ncbi:CLUMA_CG005453, isoform A [Clunio marinus]|uniref:CLUMA_CG005453, isoform A n=1 Tax=Clunio marinus TaxID=568069 RepID=A0A1J1HV02_9DIPT|nr:CLUMA_CG005453, isoform A [Clunio marinus]